LPKLANLPAGIADAGDANDQKQQLSHFFPLLFIDLCQPLTNHCTIPSN